MALWKAWPAVAALVITGCASIPDLTVSYYFPHAKTQFAVTQTVGCNPKVDGQHRLIRSVISVTPTITNSADLDWKDEKGIVRQGHLHYRAFEGTFSDGDAVVTLTPDGRLIGVNATSGGQGDAIVKNLITVAGAIGLLGPPPSVPFVKNNEDLACEQVDIFSAIGAADGGKSPAVVTMTFNVTITYKATTEADPTFAVDTVSSPDYSAQSGDQKSIALVPDAASKPVYIALGRVLGEQMMTRLNMLSAEADLRVMTATSPSTGNVPRSFPLELNKVAVLNLEIVGYAGDMKQRTQIWGGAVPVPMRETYMVPIPQPATFGKTAFGIALSDYGSITSLHYGDGSGAPDASDAMGQIAKALQPKSASDKAADLKGQADLIAAQQRLIGCEVSPSTCK